MKTYLALAITMLLPVLLPGCATLPRPLPPPVHVSMAEPTAEAKSPVAAISSAREENSRAEEHAAVLSVQLATARENLEATNQSFNTVIKEVQRLRDQRSASENELIQLYDAMVAQEKRSLGLAKDLIAAEVSLADERKLRKSVTVTLGDVERSAVAKDAEAKRLREQLADAARANNELLIHAETNAATAQATAGAVDKLRGESAYKTKLLTGIGVAFALYLLMSLAAIAILIKSRLSIL